LHSDLRRRGAGFYGDHPYDALVKKLATEQAER
jgi:hypothetical protein